MTREQKLVLAIGKDHLTTIYNLLEKKLGSEDAVDNWFAELATEFNPKVGSSLVERINAFKSDVGEENYAAIAANPALLQIVDKWATEKREAALNSVIDKICEKLSDNPNFKMTRDEIWNAMLAIKHI